MLIIEQVSEKNIRSAINQMINDEYRSQLKIAGAELIMENGAEQICNLLLGEHNGK